MVKGMGWDGVMHNWKGAKECVWSAEARQRKRRASTNG